MFRVEITLWSLLLLLTLKFKMWRGPLRPLCFLREREDTPSDWGFLSLPKTHSLLPALPKGSALWNPEWLTERVFWPMFLRKFAFRKLVANRRPNYICKSNFHCSPWAGTPLNLLKYILCRPTKLGAESKPSYVCKTDSSCPHCPLESCMGFRAFDCLKSVDCSFAENISCRLSAPSPVNLCKFACGKLGADGKPN